MQVLLPSSHECAIFLGCIGPRRYHDGRDEYELEQIIVREVDEWKSGVEVNSTDFWNPRGNPSGSRLEVRYFPTLPSII